MHKDSRWSLVLGRSLYWNHRGSVERIKKELPSVKTILGVSNISFGLDAYPRRVLNSVFMHEAVDHGLDMAIVNYTKIYPLYKIPQEEVELALNLFTETPIPTAIPCKNTWRTSPV